MTEEEKIFAGHLFDARTKELRDIKHKAHELCRKYNQIDEYDEGRSSIIKEFIGTIGKSFIFKDRYSLIMVRIPLSVRISLLISILW